MDHIHKVIIPLRNSMSDARNACHSTDSFYENEIQEDSK